MSDPLEKMATKQALKPGIGPLSAQYHNLSVDAINRVMKELGPLRAQETGVQIDREVWMVNDGDTDLDEFGVCAWEEFAIKPADSEPNFRNQTILHIAPPSSSAPFAIAQDSIGKDGGNRCGIVRASGTSKCKVNITDASHRYANAIDGDYTMLLSSATPTSCEILETEGGTGVVWALVRLGNAAKPAAQFVRCTNSSSVNLFNGYSQAVLESVAIDPDTSLPVFTTVKEIVMYFPESDNYPVTGIHYIGEWTGQTITGYFFSLANANTGNALTDPTHWLQAKASVPFALANPGSFAWTNIIPFEVGDLTISGGDWYFCIVPNTNQIPPNATYWLLVDTDAGPYDVVTTYSAGQYAEQILEVLVANEGAFVQAKTKYFDANADINDVGFAEFGFNGGNAQAAVNGSDGTGFATFDLIPPVYDDIGAEFASHTELALNGNSAPDTIVDEKPFFSVNGNPGAWANVSGLVFCGGIYTGGGVTGFITAGSGGTTGLTLPTVGTTLTLGGTLNYQSGGIGKTNITAGAPAVGNDSTQGYAIGSEWIG